MALVFVTSNAKTVTAQQAKVIAENFLSTHSDLSSKSMNEASTADMREVYRATSHVGDKPLYYIFNREGAAGFVIVSADDRAAEVLGYSTESSFDANNIPANVEWWLSQYGSEIERAVNSVETMSAGDNRMNAQNSWPAISPLIKTTWNQEWPYNNLCPTIGTQHCVTGCVATMMAQVMRYFEWPSQAIGYNEYQWNGQTLSMDFSTVDFDWANIPASGEPWTTQERQAVARLMQVCGYSVYMDYGLDASAAAVPAAKRALTNNFKYEAEYLERDLYAGDWETLIYNELSQKRPVCYGGWRNDGDGHAFICDGYTPVGLYHFNWGWGGYYDGYFRLNALNPIASLGGFNNEQCIIYNIRPVKITKVDGIWYTIDGSTAIVTAPKDNMMYEGDFFVPTAIPFEGKTYPVVKMSGDVMENCQNLTSFVVNAPIINEIYDKAFAESDRLTKVSLPSSVKRIGNYAFGDCEALREVNTGSNVEFIGTMAFYNCPALEHIDLGNKLREIGNYAFQNCSALQNVSIPKTVEKIGIQAFYESSGLIDLVLGDALVELGERAFLQSPSLRSVTFGKGLKTIRQFTFYGCENLETVNFGGGLEEIESYAFSNCYNLKEVALPPSLKFVDECAFYFATGLTTLTMGNNVETIGNRAFANCKKLSEVILPNSVTYIGEEAFYNLPLLNYVRLGGNVEYIGPWAFFNGEEIARIDCYALEPPVYGENSFYISVDWSNPELHVCKGLAEVYRSAPGWCDFVNIIDDLNAEEGGVDDIVADNHPETNNVYNLNGKLVMKNATESDLQALPAGVYIYGNRKIVR